MNFFELGLDVFFYFSIGVCIDFVILSSSSDLYLYCIYIYIYVFCMCVCIVLVCFCLFKQQKDAVCIHMSIGNTCCCQVVGVSQNSGQTTFVHIMIEVTIFMCETSPHLNVAVARFYLECFLKFCLAMVARKQLQWYHSTMPVACWWAVAEGHDDMGPKVLHGKTANTFRSFTINPYFVCAFNSHNAQVTKTGKILTRQPCSGRVILHESWLEVTSSTPTTQAGRNPRLSQGIGWSWNDRYVWGQHFNHIPTWYTLKTCTPDFFFWSHYFSILFVFIDISGRGCCREQVHQIQKLGPTPLIVGKVLAHSFNESYTLIIKVQGHRITMTRNLEQWQRICNSD